MKWLKTLSVVTLVALWALASNHCKLEELPGFGFLVCCDHEGAGPHEDNDCEGDACATLETGLYKTEESVLMVSAPSLMPVAFLFAQLVEPLPPRTTAPFPVAQPELSKVWQFSYRTAMPPRAPSVVS